MQDSQKLLAECPRSPNCVSSLADPSDTEHHIQPLPAEGIETLEKLKKIILSYERTTLVAESPGRLSFEFRSRIFRFVDDVHFVWSPKENVIHVRSASRLGYGDMGVNRKRVEQIRTDLLKTLSAKEGLTP